MFDRFFDDIEEIVNPYGMTANEEIITGFESEISLGIFPHVLLIAAGIKSPPTKCTLSVSDDQNSIVITAVGLSAADSKTYADFLQIDPQSLRYSANNLTHIFTIPGPLARSTLLPLFKNEFNKIIMDSPDQLKSFILLPMLITSLIEYEPNIRSALEVNETDPTYVKANSFYQEVVAPAAGAFYSILLAQGMEYKEIVNDIAAYNAVKNLYASLQLFRSQFGTLEKEAEVAAAIIPTINALKFLLVAMNNNDHLLTSESKEKLKSHSLRQFDKSLYELQQNANANLPKPLKRSFSLT